MPLSNLSYTTLILTHSPWACLALCLYRVYFNFKCLHMMIKWAQIRLWEDQGCTRCFDSSLWWIVVTLIVCFGLLSCWKKKFWLRVIKNRIKFSFKDMSLVRYSHPTIIYLSDMPKTIGSHMGWQRFHCPALQLEAILNFQENTHEFDPAKSDILSHWYVDHFIQGKQEQVLCI